MKNASIRIGAVAALITHAALACTPSGDAQPNPRNSGNAVTTGSVDRNTAPAPVAVAPENGAWKTLAANYLDKRSAKWLTSPPNSGQRVDCALSCHTTHPYLFSRPLLGSGDGDETARLRAQIEARVAFEGKWPEQTPWYGKDGSRKAKESLGSEAVLNAVTLALHDHALKRPTTPAVVQAVSHMWEAQREDGSFDWLDFGLEPWEAGNDSWAAALAAVAVGHAFEKQPPNLPWKLPIEKLLGFVHARQNSANLHDQLAFVWASTVLEGVLDNSARAGILSTASAAQRSDGGWSNKSLIGSRADDVSDAYATAFTTFVLCLASESNPSTASGIRWLRNHQGEDGGWATPSANGDSERGGRFMTDAATAYATLALATCSS